MPTSPGLAVSAPSSSCCQWRHPGSPDPSEVYLNDGPLNMKPKYKISPKKREKTKHTLHNHNHAAFENNPFCKGNWRFLTSDKPSSSYRITLEGGSIPKKHMQIENSLDKPELGCFRTADFCQEKVHLFFFLPQLFYRF